MSATEQVGNDGLTDAERKAYAESYARGLGSKTLTRAEKESIQTYVHRERPEPMTEREFLGLDTVVNNSLVRLNAAETAADMLVTLYRTGITPHPSKFAELRAAVEGWEKNR